MTAVDRAACLVSLAGGLAEDTNRRLARNTAQAARAAAVAIRTLPDSNARSSQYFDACRTAHRLHTELRNRCGAAITHWNNLSAHYGTIWPLATRSPGQTRSMNAVNALVTRANTADQNARTAIVTIRGWITVSPIYANPGTTGNVREEDVPYERRLGVLPGLTFQAPGTVFPGIVGQAAWQSVPHRALDGGRGDVRVWFRVDAANNITDVSTHVPVTRTDGADSISPTENGQKDCDELGFPRSLEIQRAAAMGAGVPTIDDSC